MKAFILPFLSLMLKPRENPEQYAAGLPLQVGVTPEQMREMRDEIAHSGVANGEADVEENATPGRESSGGNDPVALPVGNVTADCNQKSAAIAAMLAAPYPCTAKGAN